MKRSFPAAAAVLIAASAACIIPVSIDEGSRWGRPPDVFRRSVPFQAGGQLKIDNAYGHVVIRGWDREDIEVTAEETWKESAAGLPSGGGAVIPRIDIETGDDGVAITARPRDETFTGDRIILLSVQVPRHVSLRSVSGRLGRLSLSGIYGEARLRLEAGDVRIENYSGSLDVEIGRGEIQAELVDLRAEDIVRLVLGDGPVAVSLYPGFTGRLEAMAGSGTLVCDFPLDPAAEAGRVSGTIGTGDGALIFITARSGDVRIRKTI